MWPLLCHKTSPRALLHSGFRRLAEQPLAISSFLLAAQK